MSYNIRCLNCGAYLDPCETCDCERLESELRQMKKAQIARKKARQAMEEADRAWQEFDYK